MSATCRLTCSRSFQFQAVDAANGPADHGGGGSFWQGGAAPAVDSGGDIYVNAADGSFNANQGGNNYGDSMLKLKLSASGFQVADWFTPFNADCIDLYDLEIGSGGVALLPTDFTNGLNLALAAGKEGRLFLVNLNSMGHFNATADTQITEDFMIGSNVCWDSITGDVAEGTSWNRLYCTASYWNGNVYAAPTNSPLKQYQFQSGLLNQSPLATSPTVTDCGVPIPSYPQMANRRELFGPTKRPLRVPVCCTPMMRPTFQAIFGTAT